MRFKCQECSTSYKIADEKVQGKVLKVRCRKCRAIVVVKGPPKRSAPQGRAGASATEAAKSQDADDLSEATRMMPVSELREQLKVARGAGREDEERTTMMPLPELERVRRAAREDREAGAHAPAAGPSTPAPAADAPSWHAVIHGKQEGPLSLETLAARVRAGEVTPRTYVWSEGMDAWAPIREVPALGHLFADIETRRRVNGEDRQAERGAELPFDDDEVPAADGDAGGAAESGLDASGLESLFDDLPDPEEAPGEPPADPFEEALSDPLGAAPDPFAAVAAGDGLEPPPPRETTQMYIVASGVQKQKSPLRIALFAVGFVAFLGGFAYLLSATGSVDFGALIPSGGSRSKPSVEGAWSRRSGDADAVRRRLLGLDKEAQGAGGATKGGAAAARGAAAPADEEGPLKTKEQLPVEALDEEQEQALAALYASTAGKKVKFQVRSEKPSVKGVDSAKSPIDPKIIAEKFQASMPAYQDCVMRELRRNPNFNGGRAVLTVSIAPSGIVTAARLDDRLLDRSDVGTCIKRAAKRMVFPSFGGEEAIDIEAPLILSSAL